MHAQLLAVDFEDLLAGIVLNKEVLPQCEDLLAHLVAGSAAAAPKGLSFLLAEEAPIMPLFHRSTRLLVKPWVTRFPTTGL